MSQSLDSIKVNGVSIPIIFEKETHLPIVTAQIILRCSGSIEDGKQSGLARFTANMLNEGTKKLGSVAFSEQLEERAIHLSTHAGFETFVFEISSLKEQFPYSMSMLKELLMDPNFTQESLLKVKSQTLGMLSSKESDFDYIANINLKKLIYKNTPMQEPTAGDSASIKALTLDDVTHFYHEHLDLSNMVIVAGGDIDIQAFKKELMDVLKVLPVGAKRQLVHFDANGDENNQTVHKETEQAYIYFGAPLDMSSSDSDDYKSKVASFILGESGFGSRLMEAVRVKKGLAYSIYSRNSINKSHSAFTGYLQTKNENRKEAERIVKNVIDDFVKNGATKDELEQAKKFLLGSEPLRNETLSQRLNRAFFEYYRGFKLGHSKEILEKIDALSLGELNAFIKKHREITQLSFSVVTN
ncbi:M16 family metallopeptidase [Sulfurospirillum sp. 1612]|uniref:M16 family metallopeptidase n=1 Tax=Sulfurospirillum sp. 1612 TaxID=3094835 RepID=UPI002F94B455